MGGIFTRKVEIADENGDLFAEIKGSIRKVEVGDRKTDERFLMPIQTTDEPVEIACEIPGDLEASMHACERDEQSTTSGLSNCNLFQFN